MEQAEYRSSGNYVELVLC